MAISKIDELLVDFPHKIRMGCLNGEVLRKKFDHWMNINEV